MTGGGRANQPASSGLHLVVTLVALLATIYLALQVIGFLFKLLFIAVAALVGLAAWRAWRTGS